MTSLQIPSDLDIQLTQLAENTGQTKEFIAIQALREFLEKDAWQIAEIEKTLKNMDAGAIASKEKVEAFYKKWGVQS